MNLSNQVVYLRYGELTLKGKNVKMFKQQAFTNLQYALKEIKSKIHIAYDYLIISDYESEKQTEIISQIITLPGFSYCTIGYIIEQKVEAMIEVTKFLLKDVKTFKIEARRTNKSYQYNSDQLKRLVADECLNCMPLKVDLHNPELIVHIDIKQHDAIIFGNKFQTIGGLPIGISGKAIMLLSGGIDSPIASHLLLKRGMHVDYLTFMTPPHTTTEALDKVKSLVKCLSNTNHHYRPKLYICNYTPILQELQHITNPAYRITLMRRSFLRIANMLHHQHEYHCLATGDALGQVASQTIESLNVIDKAIETLILRPLIGFDKQQIINLAKQIQTYEISILPFSDSCSLFAPQKPITKPKMETVLELESELNLLFDLEKHIINNIEVIEND